MVSNSKKPHFNFLDEERRLSVTELFAWMIKQSMTGGYINVKLISVIDNPLNVTDQEGNNQTILRHLRFGKVSEIRSQMR